MSDYVNGTKVAARQHIVICISTIENLANGSSVPKYGSLTVLHKKLGFVSFSPSWCTVQFRFCSLKTNLQKRAYPHQTVSIIALEVSRNDLVHL